MDLNLNLAPPGGNWSQEGTSSQGESNVVETTQTAESVVLQNDATEPSLRTIINDYIETGQPAQLAPSMMDGVQTGQSAQPAPIMMDGIQTNQPTQSVVIQNDAQNNSRRTSRSIVEDAESEERTRATQNNRHKRRRVPPNQTIINCDLYINLESSSNSMRDNVTKMPPPPKEPTFNCPICMGPLVEEMSTRCGHIFCKTCIKTAISTQGKCPTCRKNVTVRELIRIFLPSTS